MFFVHSSLPSSSKFAWSFTMAEGPARDTQLVMEHIPSRLRNEIRPSPSDTDGLLEEDAVARPPSHFVSLGNERRGPESSTSSKKVSDTKSQDQSDEDLDPESLAVLRNTTAIKVDTMPMIFKMLQRPGTSDSAFFFERPKDSRDKPSAHTPLEASKFTIQESPSTAPVLVAEPALTHGMSFHPRIGHHLTGRQMMPRSLHLRFPHFPCSMRTTRMPGPRIPESQIKKQQPPMRCR